MHDEALLRYSRHILLPDIGIEGQARIRAAQVLLVGAGGLGSPAAYYLASAGVGALTVVDHDVVDLTNLQRQILHSTDRIGQSKAQSARQTLAGINPEVAIHAIEQSADAQRLARWVSQATVVLDCTDNFVTRHAINQACVAQRKPLVSGAAIRFDGQLAVFDAARADSPCYACLFPHSEAEHDEPCAVTGVFAPLTGMVGAMQAAEALKLIVGAGEPCVGRLVLIEALRMQVRTVLVPRDPQCVVCGGLPYGA
ncbi:MAG TPA: molybdopterin-synthase adenylyltransferase MoeB [Burkholderiaceae bacterium]|nr:molybdopterin-synthase adenylyltransferase MoeB [Burkholderiaceae bacterium]